MLRAFKPGDKVRLKRPPHTQMKVKGVSAAGVLCEWSEGSTLWTWPAEALEPVKTIKRGPSTTAGQRFPRI
jgi:uncharacterized protein YodC (DUF2158 family)